MAIQIAYRQPKRSGFGGILGGLLGTAANALTGGLVGNAVGKILGNTAGSVAGNAVSGAINNDYTRAASTTLGSNSPQPQIGFNNPVQFSNQFTPATPQQNGMNILSNLQQNRLF